MERRKKTLQELTIKDNFMFVAVMTDPENAKGMLELILDEEIDHVEVCYEKSIIFNPECKGIRLDVYIKDDKGTHFDVEMQVANEKLLRRSRYYHSQIDMDLLSTGMKYEELPEAYVIFICDYDPIGLGKYKYTRKQIFEEDDSYEYDDGSHTIFLSTKGTNDDEVPEALVHFLKYVGAERGEADKDYSDVFVKRLQKSVTKIKFDRGMEVRYMHFAEIMRDEYKAGKREGEKETFQRSIIGFLTDIAPISDHLRDRILSVDDLDTLNMLLKKAARVSSLEEFEKIEF